jgi:hypothetical protein
VSPERRKGENGACSPVAKFLVDDWGYIVDINLFYGVGVFCPSHSLSCGMWMSRSKLEAAIQCWNF